MSLNDRFVWRSDDGMMLIFGRIEPSFNKYQFKCSIYLEYIMHTMNTRDFRKLIKLIVWACEDPEVILKALRIMSDGAQKAIERENEDEWVAYFSGQRDAYANAIAMLESIVEEP